MNGPVVAEGATVTAESTYVEAPGFPFAALVGAAPLSLTVSGDGVAEGALVRHVFDDGHGLILDRESLSTVEGTATVTVSAVPLTE